MTTRETRTASATAETTNRAGVRGGWLKTPLALHAGLAVGMFAGALALNHFLKMNLFLGLVLGYGLSWVGGKVKDDAHQVIKTWALILRMLGGVIILVTLWQSGVRHVAEVTVLEIDQKLTATAKGGATGFDPSGLIEKDFDGSLITVDMRTGKVGEVYTIEMNLGDTVVVHKKITRVGQVPIWHCFVVKGAAAEQAKLVAPAETVHMLKFRLDADSAYKLFKDGITRVIVVLKLVEGHENPCGNQEAFQKPS